MGPLGGPFPDAQAVAQGPTDRNTSVGSGVLDNAPNLLADTDLLVRGVVGEPTTFLSNGGMNIYTEYPPIDTVTLYDSGVAASARPGPASRRPITVMKRAVRWPSTAARSVKFEAELPPLHPGTECLFLL
jgi:hypothetical protein